MLSPTIPLIQGHPRKKKKVENQTPSAITKDFRVVAFNEQSQALHTILKSQITKNLTIFEPKPTRDSSKSIEESEDMKDERDNVDRDAAKDESDVAEVEKEKESSLLVTNKGKEDVKSTSGKEFS